MREIRFYASRGAWGFLSNFYRAIIVIDGAEWATVEHYFQGQKCAATAEIVRAAPTAAAAKRLGRRATLRADWDRARDHVMAIGLCAKFTQWPELRERLLATGDAVLIEAAPRDCYWGIGADGGGRNRLGQLLMDVRTALVSGII